MFPEFFEKRWTLNPIGSMIALGKYASQALSIGLTAQGGKI